MKVRIETLRRPSDSHGADSEPWVAVATDGAGRLIALQYGAAESIALSRCWRHVREEHERRHSIIGELELP